MTASQASAPGGQNLADMTRYAGEATRLLKSIANEHRLLILCRLAEGERSVSELNERVPLSQSALSQHLSRLRGEGVVIARREAQSVYYRLAGGPVGRLIEALHDIYCGDGAAGPPARGKKR